MQSTLLKLILLTSITLLFACSAKVKHIIVTPELSVISNNVYQQKQAQINFTDLRRSNRIVQVLRIDEAAELYSTQKPLVDIIKTSLSAGFKSSGLQLQPLASNKIEVFIDNALISVQQELLKYIANNEIVIRVVVKNGQKTLTKTFKISGKSNGPFNADIAVLERDFNQQLTKLLMQITQNEELRAFIN
jgi:uncharacterized lipoprotein